MRKFGGNVVDTNDKTEKVIGDTIPLKKNTKHRGSPS